MDDVPSLASVSKWKRGLLATVALLIRTHGKLLAIVDGTGIRLGRGSSHYLRRIRKKREYLLLTILYVLEIDAFFDVVVAPDTFSEIEAFRNHLLKALVEAEIF